MTTTMPVHVPEPVTLAELQQSLEIVAMGPTGRHYRIRPMNIERYALAGGLPKRLLNVATKGVDAFTEVLEAEEQDAALSNEAAETMDNLVRALIITPDLSGDAISLLPPPDYRWALLVALGELDRDGEGRRLWGKEPLTTWGTFREEHGCPPDCPQCERARRPVAEDQ